MDLAGREHAQKIRQMFGRIAGRYDLLNRLMTLGQDRRWRKAGVACLALRPGALVLDVGAGTGDLTREILRQSSGSRVVAVDFTLPMLRRGKARIRQRQAAWVIADAHQLPFAAETFDAAASAFLLRNVASLNMALAEQHRVLKPAGRLVCLDTTPPPRGPWRPFVRFHLECVIPTLGRIISGNAQAYRYLPQSTSAFLSADTLADRLRAAGLDGVDYDTYMLGSIAIHRGRKRPADEGAASSGDSEGRSGPG
jgi:demethylmenaquinone methyltransferase / 2-methoxy-6-polyprenyl-1,4-benzoquinol methylase